MGEKDLTEKKLEDYPEVFADIMNVLVMKKNYIQPELLTDGPTESVYKAEGKNRRQFRDISKYYKEAEINIASLGIENQTQEDRDMPIRIMGYDYGQYRHQIDIGNERFPSITIVLNFSDKKWSEPKHLKELFHIPEELEEIVQDYQVRVYDIAYLEDEVINEFTSTFKHVAHFFKNKRKNKDYRPLDEKIDERHLTAFLDLLSAFTGDEKYREMEDIILEKQKEGKVITMCTVVERFMEEGRKEGREEGREEGLIQGMIETYQEFGLSEEEIIEKLERKMSISREMAEQCMKKKSIKGH